MIGSIEFDVPEGTTQNVYTMLDWIISQVGVADVESYLEEHKKSHSSNRRVRGQRYGMGNCS